MKKRILSLILALSMVLSVLPLGAFAEGSTGELVIKRGCPVGTSGNGWSYNRTTDTLTLTSGTYNFSYTYPQNPNATGSTFVTAVAFEIQLDGQATITGGTFKGKVSNKYGTISNGIFESDVTNDSNINGGNFQKMCTVTNGGTISDGTFAGNRLGFCPLRNHAPRFVVRRNRFGHRAQRSHDADVIRRIKRDVPVAMDIGLPKRWQRHRQTIAKLGRASVWRKRRASYCPDNRMRIVENFGNGRLPKSYR